ncbi:FAS1 domain-containing protein [Basidiobolus meristosporus CBS 931.73]|uniref:FAS1 domain-containing protein n=1 Tax=Basidiobolus meristosporus CBS 931.73 TaxID=1314790 RepID=A0A1Y1XRG8_9FUNG|nr:FAS1 domain-containing protein [Basidiobolus meristosporus CBS 931.73]|eukprot:ORX88351.1 FAS1 domain-containing protein [Basidiobolus meristosporus CBS 931.73]
MKNLIHCTLGLLLTQAVIAQSAHRQHVLSAPLEKYQEEDSWSPTIFDLLKKDKRFSRVLDILASESSLSEHFTNPREQITFFAPTNDAIAEFLDEDGDGDADDEERRLFQLRKILKYQTIPGKVLSRHMKNMRVLKTIVKETELHGKHQRIKISNDRGLIVLNEGTEVEEADLRASNGVVHVISRLLNEPLVLTDTLVSLPKKFSAVNLALQKTGLNHTLETSRGLTFLAPTNLAFRNLGCRNLRYLFSVKGRKDLEKIIKHHLSPKLAYSSSFRHLEYYSRGMPVSDVPTHGELEKSIKKNKYVVCRSRSLPSLSGARIQIEVKRPHSKSSTLWADHESRILYTDLISRNGVVHVTDRVLIPEDVDISFDDWWNDDQYCSPELQALGME